MIFDPKDKDWKEKLKQAEQEELEDYCNEQGFTKEETAKFVENSMKQLYKDEALDE